jgi:hypothetical protein
MNITHTDFHLLNIPNLSKFVGRRALPWKYAQFRMSCVSYAASFLMSKIKGMKCWYVDFSLKIRGSIINKCACPAFNIVYAHASVAGSFEQWSACSTEL